VRVPAGMPPRLVALDEVTSAPLTYMRTYMRTDLLPTSLRSPWRPRARDYLCRRRCACKRGQAVREMPTEATTHTPEYVEHVRDASPSSLVCDAYPGRQRAARACIKDSAGGAGARRAVAACARREAVVRPADTRGHHLYRVESTRW